MTYYANVTTTSMPSSSTLTRRMRIGTNIINLIGSASVSWFCLHIAMNCLRANPPQLISFSIWTTISVVFGYLTWDKAK